MKIVHCCLAQFYIDNYGYQENILPKMHKIQGHQVYILASTETFIQNVKLGYLSPSSYITNEGIPITRVGYVKWLPHYVGTKLRIYSNIYRYLDSVKPDIIFIHDIQFLSILKIAKYAKNNPLVKIYVDGHADFINSARSWISRVILHRIIYRFCAQAILPYTTKFYGVLPLRVDFMMDVYKIPESKLELLVLGGDLSNIDFNMKSSIRNNIRQKHQINDSDFLIISGGKIDHLKNIHVLLQAFQEIKELNTHLVIFGEIDEKIEAEIGVLLKAPRVSYVGWLSTDDISEYFLASDLAIFPGTHSVLWEQAIAIGLPAIFKKWIGMHHLDVGGNVVFLEKVNVEIIKSTILQLMADKPRYNKMRTVAETKGTATFSYFEIAQKSIQS